jgi:hypothetical protein
LIFDSKILAGQMQVDPQVNSWCALIKALTKEQRESFMKMVMEDKDGEDF